MRFCNSVILVTGGAGDLGSSIVRAFINEGAHVVIADIDKQGGEALAATISASGVGKSDFLPLDVSDERAWHNVLDKVERNYGTLDVLVNNAGFFQPNVPFEQMSLELWQKHFAVNSDGLFLGCKHGILRLKKHGGAIVNIGSSLSLKANATASAYCASKAAMLMTTRTAAISAGRYDIRVNAVLPGPVENPMLMSNMLEGQSEIEFIDSLRSRSPLGRLATCEDIARAILFLADPANVAISGVCLPIDGGNTIAI